MHIPRIYYNAPISIHEEIILPEDVSHHLIHVLRLKAGEKLIVFNGQGGEYLSEIMTIHKKCVHLQIAKINPIQKESPLKITLGQGISRSEKMNYVIQKAVELGVHAIVPLSTERSIIKLTGDRLAKKKAHWEKIIIAACEQSGRCIVPKIENPTTLASWLTKTNHAHKFICTLNSNASIPVVDTLHSTSILIGPESGLTTKEIEQAKANHFIEISLGPRTLRTETATVVALTILQSRWGDI